LGKKGEKVNKKEGEVKKREQAQEGRRVSSKKEHKIGGGAKKKVALRKPREGTPATPRLRRQTRMDVPMKKRKSKGGKVPRGG